MKRQTELKHWLENNSVPTLEFEGIFEKEGEEYRLAGFVRLFYNGIAMLTVSDEDFKETEKTLADVLLHRLNQVFHYDVRLLDEWEEKLEQMRLDILVKEERLERQKLKGGFTKKQRVQVEKERERLLKRLAGQEKKIVQLKKESPYVQLVLVFRKMKEDGS